MNAEHKLHLMQLLQRFRVEEWSHTSVLLLNDRDAQRVIIAWQSMAADWQPADGDPPPASDESALWEWIWDGVEVDFDDLAARSGMQVDAAESKFETLWPARLIYPDGGINRFAEGVMKTEIAKILPKPKPKPKGAKS